MINKICKICSKEFRPNKPQEKYCSRDCRKVSYKNSSRKMYLKKHIRYHNKQCPICYHDFITSNIKKVYCSSICKRIIVLKQKQLSGQKDQCKIRRNQRTKQRRKEDIIFKQKSNNWHRKYQKERRSNDEQFRLSILQNSKRYYRKHLEKECARRLRRRTFGNIDENIIKQIHTIYNEQCIFCGSSEKLTIEHLIPVTRDGTNDIDNLALACESCNYSKSNKLVLEYIGFLIRTKQLNIHPNGIRLCQ